MRLPLRLALATCTVILIVNTTLADTFGPYTYTVSGDQATITAFDKAYSGAISITNTLGGYPVTRIGNYAFSSCTSLTSVTIPDSVTTIGEDTFCGCSSLISVTLGDSVTSIGNGAFHSCTRLTAIDVALANETYSSLAGVLFNNSQTVLVQWPGGKTGDYTVPDGVAGIGAYAFESTSLTGITLGNSITSIGDYAFSSCTNLTSITLPNSLTSIGYYAFSSCTDLTSITLGNNVTSIGYGAFRSCTSLTSVTIPDSVTSIGSYAFWGCSSLISATLGNGVTSIGNGAFRSCTCLTAIDVALTNETYSSLAGVLFNNSQTVLIQWPGGKTGDYTVPDSVTSIGIYAFESTSLTAITLGKRVTSIEYGAFRDCTSLNRVTIIPDSVTSIGSRAFWGCTSLTSVTIPDSVTSIGDYAFWGCSSLTSITLGNSVTSIGIGAFLSCTGLISVTLGNSVSSIGNYAFDSCTCLQRVYFTGPPAVCGQDVFPSPLTVIYYLPAFADLWPSTFDGHPAVLWNPEFATASLIAAEMSCTVTGTPNIPVAFEARTNLLTGPWLRLHTTNLTAGSLDFHDPDATNYPTRFYRITGP